MVGIGRHFHLRAIIIDKEDRHDGHSDSNGSERKRKKEKERERKRKKEKERDKEESRTKNKVIEMFLCSRGEETVAENEMKMRESPS